MAAEVLSSTCYYPNGDASSESDIPCKSSNGAVPCCPMNWNCTDNGLCYLPNEKYYGRYTCTDRNWGTGCPDICTHNSQDNTANGNEAVLECDSNKFCCDTNRPDLTNPNKACCKTTDSFFSLNSEMSMIPLLPSPSSGDTIIISASVGPIGSELPSGLTASAIIVTEYSSDPSSPSPTATTSATSQGTSSSPSLTVSTSSSSAVPAAATGPPPVPQNNSGGKNLAAIIAPAVLVPLAVIAIAVAFLILWRRRRRSAGPESSTYPSGFTTEPKYEAPLSPHSPYASANKSQMEGLSPDLTDSSTPATAQTGTSRFESPKIQGTSLSTEPPASSTGVWGSSRLSQMSSFDQPQLAEIGAEPVRSPDP